MPGAGIVHTIKIVRRFTPQDSGDSSSVAWKLCSTMKAGDVTDTLETALAASGLDRAIVRQRPRLLSDNGSSYVASDLVDRMSEHDTKHAAEHPTTR